MKNLRILFGLLPMLAIVGCASIEVRHDYVTDVDFSIFKTFNWLPVRAEVPTMQANVDRVKDAVENRLHSKGFRLAVEDPDFFVALYGGRDHKIDVTTFWEGYMEAEEVQIRQYEEDLLILDIIDSKTEQRLWRGEARGEFNPSWPQEKQIKTVNEAVEKLLRDFPPF